MCRVCYGQVFGEQYRERSREIYGVRHAKAVKSSCRGAEDDFASVSMLLLYTRQTLDRI
jgi:hypothetical protein